MVRKSPLILFVLLSSLMAAASTAAATYYIAANGSDTNNGTSKTTAWQHAPGMPKCTGTCAGHTPVAGDQYIFRGGDTWHFGNSAASPYVGAGGWTWIWSGNGSNPIYIGVDQSWYSGSAWVRPVMSGDNQTSTSFVTSCVYDQSSLSFLSLRQVSFVTVDNFEWPGKCWSSPNTYQASIYNYNTDHVIISSHFFHGWTATLGSVDAHYSILGDDHGAQGATTYNQIVGNVFDGSDSSQGAANSQTCANAYVPSSPCQSGEAIYSEGYDIHNNVFRYLSNMIVVVNAETVHDNLFEYLYNTYTSNNPAGPHSNVLNEVTNIPGGTTSFYNNVVRHTHVTEDIYLSVGSTGYVFNNVFFDNMNYFGGSAPTNCMSIQAVSSTGTQTLYFYNNTIDSMGTTGGGCELQFMPTGAPTYDWNGTAYFENNHLIGYSNLGALTVCRTTGKCTITDNGNEIFQTESAANNQGYTANNNYAPTATSNATVGAGANLSGQCSTFSDDSALCNGTEDGASEQPGEGGEIAFFPTIPLVQRSTAWDSGAYEFSGAQPPAPPSGLSAVVQ